MNFSRIPPGRVAWGTRDNQQTCRRAGLTLLEILIVLLILAVAAGLAVPMLRRPAAEPERALQEVIDQARRVAVRRAQAVLLTLQVDSNWRVETRGRAEPERLLSGKLSAAPASEVRLQISPLGACTFDTQVSEVVLVLDPLHCELRADKR